MKEEAGTIGDLHKTFSRGVPALRGLDPTVETGRVYGLPGPNGAG